MVNWVLTRASIYFNRERIAFSTNGDGTTGYPHTQEKEVKHLIHTTLKK